jgi:competence protein ComFC
MYRLLGYIWEGFIDHLYPDGIVCYFCGRALSGFHKYGICPDCIESIEFIGDRNCIRCGKLLEDGTLCSDCRSFYHFYDRAFSLCVYQGAVKEWIYSFKYGNRPYIARPFALMMVDRITEMGLNRMIDAIAPVPLHGKKLRTRGYNQAEVLAGAVSRGLGIKLLRPLIRIKNTPPLSGLNRLQRIEQLEQAFVLNPHYAFYGIKNLLLIDDIYTTGTTVNQCSRLLKEGGCERIYVFTIASGRNP